MIRQVLAHTRHQGAVTAAAKAADLQCALRAFSPSDLVDLKAPVLLVFDADGEPAFEPDFLQQLRRAHPGGVRFSPALVFCRTKEEAENWRDAGAATISEKADANELSAAFRAALMSEHRWVASANYVGPDRRAHRAVFRVRKRRREDGVAPTVRVSSPDLICRRISLAAQLLHGSSIESRRAFGAMIDELEASAAAHSRGDLSTLALTLRMEADRYIQDANAHTGSLEAAVAQLDAAIYR